MREFNIEELVNKQHGSEQLWALWYPQVYEDFFESVTVALESPISETESEPEDVYRLLRDGLDSLIGYASNVDKDTQNLMNIRDRVEEFRENQDDSITITLMIYGSKTRIECVSGYSSEGVVTVDMEGTPTHAETSALREYTNSLTDSFCSCFPQNHRPNSRFKRELCISVKKTDESQRATIDVNSTRMSYTLLEKLCLKLGLSSPYRDDSIDSI